MPIRRSYADHGDACAGAHGVELIGEVWTYPILREMFLGPKRFGELSALVHGITPAVLTTRLRELERRGLVRSTALAAPARGNVYELTDWGHALEPLLDGIARWAHGSPGRDAAGGGLTPDGMVLALKAMAGPGPRSAVRIAAVLHDDRADRPDAYTYCLEWGVDGLRARRGDCSDPAASVRGDSTSFAEAVFGEGELLDVDGRLELAGDRGVLQALARSAREGSISAAASAAPQWHPGR